jgi:predicted nucleic acid-binding protein
LPKDRRYWDSDIFLSWFNKEQNKYEKCLGVMKGFDNGEIEIVTSSLTLVEVLWVKGSNKITKEQSEKICRFFERENIIIVNLDRYIAEYARDLVWNNNVQPKDAVHLATAIKAKIPLFDTFDKDLLSLNGLLGNPPLIITIPNISYQGDMFE